MADTYEAFYNGKPLNPNRGLPTMTYAQAEASGLTESERLWCRTDGEDTPVTADDIPYDSNNSVKDKIDDLNDSKVSIATSLDNGSETGTSTRDFLVKLADKIKALDTGRYVFRYSYSGNWNAFVIASVIAKNSDTHFLVVPFGTNKIYIAYVAGSTYYCGESPAFTTLT